MQVVCIMQKKSDSKLKLSLMVRATLEMITIKVSNNQQLN